MRFETLRHRVLRRPFRPIRLTLDDGSKIVVRHPEAFMLSRMLCGVARDPEFPLLFEPEKVLSVEQLRANGNGRKRA
jgi:hypothetical protein